MANGRSSQRITIPNNLVGFFELDSVDSVFVEAGSLIVLGWLPALVFLSVCLPGSDLQNAIDHPVMADQKIRYV